MGKSFRSRKTGNRPAFGSGGHGLTRTENNAAVKKDEAILHAPGQDNAHDTWVSEKSETRDRGPHSGCGRTPRPESSSLPLAP